jgi:hypothetical protein
MRRSWGGTGCGCLRARPRKPALGRNPGLHRSGNRTASRMLAQLGQAASACDPSMGPGRQMPRWSAERRACLGRFSQKRKACVAPRKRGTKGLRLSALRSLIFVRETRIRAHQSRVYPRLKKFGFPDRLKPIWVRRHKEYGARSFGYFLRSSPRKRGPRLGPLDSRLRGNERDENTPPRRRSLRSRPPSPQAERGEGQYSGKIM